jgi:hypothetical protein
MKLLLALPALFALTAVSARSVPVVPRVSHVTIIMMENRNYGTVVGSAAAPYVNRVLIPQGVLLRNSHAVTHPSEPNYLALFSGSTQGLASDACPVTYGAPNLATQLDAAGKSFVGWAESMPHDGYTGCYTDDIYARKHVPWTDFSNVPASENRVYRGAPPAGSMPAVSWITPNLCNDMHDCSTLRGDRWLSRHLPAIIAWDARNDGLLILTWDEADPDPDGTNHIPTVLVGPMVVPGAFSMQRVDHYTLLHTIERMFALPCIAQACNAGVVTGIWRAVP